jgi:hypothetical protein
MCDSKQKSSHEHGSDFERLRSYDRLKLRINKNIQRVPGGMWNTSGECSLC